MKTKHLRLSALLFFTLSSMAFANNDSQVTANLNLDLPANVSGNTQGPQAGQRYTLTRESTFTIIRSNVPTEHNPNAAQTGDALTLPANTVLDIISSSVTPNMGATLRLAPDEPGNNSAVPSDFEVLASDFVASGARLENIAQLDQQIEDQAAIMTVNDAVALDLSYQTNTVATSRARASSSGHRPGMTYCLQNVEVKAAALGICPYKISEGYARRSLDGFETICHMTPTAYSSDLPMGSICVSHGTNGHVCDGAPCGDAKMKTGNGWYNGVGSGYSSDAGIGAIYGCVVPSGSHESASNDKPAESNDSKPAASKAPAHKAPVRRVAVKKAPVRRAQVRKAPVNRRVVNR